MAIELAVKYTNKVDERFSAESKSDRLVNQDYDFVGAKTVKVYNVSTAPMNDYTTTGISRYGTPAELDATTQEMTMRNDRSFTFTIDKVNEDETKGVLQAGTALARQLREVTIPEVDMYRYAEMAAKAGTKATPANLTKTNIYDAILAATETLDENAVPVVGRVLVVTPATYSIMKKSDDIVLDTAVGQEMKLKGVIAMLDGMEVIKIPASMLPTKFGFMVGHKIATVAPVKLAEYKIHKDVPGISGSLVEGRVYYDAFVLNNKKKALYLHKLA